MKIIVVGGGPAGLYAALLARSHLGADVQVFEQNPQTATYGFGVVLSDSGLDRLKRADAATHDAIVAASFVSRHRVIIVGGHKVFIEGGGHGAAIARLKLLQILRDACLRADVTIRHQTRIEETGFPGADLVIGADGVNSVVRDRDPQGFGTTRWTLGNRLAWYGTEQHFPYPLLSFKSLAAGHFWAAAYAYTERMATFVAECDAATWQRSGLGDMIEADRKTFVEEVFRDELGGRALISNKSTWHSLPVIRNRNWAVSNHVLIGDALHSAHPTIGSGTRIAMEDSIALIDALAASERNISNGLARFRETREPSKQKLVTAAEKSFMWYERVGEKIDRLPPTDFVFDFLTRTGRIDEKRLIAEYPRFMSARLEQWRSFAAA